MEKEWVGIQFNPIIDKDIKLKPSLEALGIESTGDHISINFTRKELKRMDENKESEKLRVAISLIKNNLSNSDYTNIYTYLNADKLNNIKTVLKEGIFKKEGIRIKLIRDKQNFINNFSDIIPHQNLINLIKKHSLMKFMNQLLKVVANREFALDQELTLELRYEDKKEWEADRDNINISIQLDIPSKT